MKKKIEHVGAFIRRHVLPPGTSVTDAARKLGVGRPALSNMLNGRASLSSEMAFRLARAFGADQQELLDRQAKCDRERRGEEERAVAVGRYVPPFLAIKAHQIKSWADTIEARQLLPVLLRTLIRSTGDRLVQVDFPGHDDAQRPGWDGWVEAEAASPWIPQGRSGWEFGTNQDPKLKAEREYTKRLSIPLAEREECTFVFVTPRKWQGKDAWAKTKNEAGEWRAVKAFDASDLEQWLEQSIAGQVWLAAKLPTPIPMQGCETPDRFWDRWRSASDPPLTAKVFAPAVADNINNVKQWLAKPSDRPLYVAGDSVEEAKAFIACLFRDCRIPHEHRDRAVIVDSAPTLRDLAQSSSPFIPIVFSPDVQCELAPVQRRLHSVVVLPRNAVDPKPDIALDLVGHKPFGDALQDMGIAREENDRLARESGRSPTILRRRLSNVAAIRTPLWAKDLQTARIVMPMAFSGVWNADSPADRKVLSDLSRCSYETVEQHVTRLIQLDDPPVWTAGRYRGVASTIDTLFAISRYLNDADVSNFIEAATTVLSEPDPALELPDDQQWAAATYGKVRRHSEGLRAGVCESLVLLAVHGNDLLQADVAGRIASAIGRLLNPLTLDTLLSHRNELPLYAEAAPDQFLALVENDLRSSDPVVLKGFTAATGPWMDTPKRIRLLQALECVAWDPKYLARITILLAQLAQTKVDDNWSPTPVSTLEAIYHSWTPQTAAPLCDRIRGVEMLATHFPHVGWHICIKIQRQRISASSHRPRWRDHRKDYGQAVPECDKEYFRSKTLDIALNWPKHDNKTLGDLIEHLGHLEAVQSFVWKLVDSYARTERDAVAKEELRERISRYVFSRSRLRSNTISAVFRKSARAACKKLESVDPIIRHTWLFAKAWVGGFDDAHIDTADFDSSKHMERVHQLRQEALDEIWKAYGWEGVTKLLSAGDAARAVGEYTRLTTSTRRKAGEILRACLGSDLPLKEKLDKFMQGYLSALSEADRANVLLAAASGTDDEQAARLFRCAPLGKETWHLLEQQPTTVRERYWRGISVSSQGVLLSDQEVAEVVNSLLKARRPRTAFNAVHWAAGRKVEPSLLKRLLVDVATVNNDQNDSCEIDADDLSDALNALNGSAETTSDEMAQLEFLFLEALDGLSDGSGHGIPSLERAIAQNPGIFAQSIALVYKRSDNGQDPPEWRVDDPDRRTAAARKAYTLLTRVRWIPGTDENGTVHAEPLRRWCTEVRRLCAEQGRAVVGDIHIGQLLSRTPTDHEGRGPCIAVCEVLDGIRSEHVEQGYRVGVYNARGPHFHDVEKGGNEERDLATLYRQRAERLSFDYPYVSGILGRIADDYQQEGTWQDTHANVIKRLFN